MSTTRRGITCFGNWVIDHVKVVDVFPAKGNLGSILRESRGTGGLAYNCSLDLAKLKTDIPLDGIGRVGDDEDGRFILEDCKRHRIDMTQVKITPNARTAYTDVMTLESTGERTFYHHRGANALLSFDDFDFDNVEAKIVHGGYILLLDGLDRIHPTYGTEMARVLRAFQDREIKTSVDVVSEDSDRFHRLVPPALRYCSHLMLNEVEAGRTTGIPLRDKSEKLVADNLPKVARKLFELGVQETVTIHMPEGCYILTAGGEGIVQPSHELPAGYVKSTVGAGDAFAAGMLYGLHEGWPLEETARLATAMGAVCLGGVTCTDAMLRLEETLEFAGKTPYRKSID